MKRCTAGCSVSMQLIMYLLHMYIAYRQGQANSPLTCDGEWVKVPCFFCDIKYIWHHGTNPAWEATTKYEPDMGLSNTSRQ